MKRPIILLLSSLFAFSACTQVTKTGWGPEQEAEYLKNRQDPSTWDCRLLEQDIQDMPQILSKPLMYGAFPVPEYGLIGENTFDGVLCSNYYMKFGDEGRNLLYACMGVNRNGMIEKYIGDKPDEVFFTILVLSDVEIGSDDDFWDNMYSDVFITSRNNPDYVGQGYIKTKNDEIDFVAFLTAGRDEYAIVNMRLFDLKYGRIVIIAPQKDGSLRSMQVKTEDVISSDGLTNRLQEIIKRTDVNDFLTDKNNI